MLYDFIMTDKSDSLPLYRQIYRSVRESIENGSMKMNSRLPSIRRLSDNLGVSKTTVIAAYDQLCAEGYIVNRPQKGYFVAADFQNSPAQIEAKKVMNMISAPKASTRRSSSSPSGARRSRTSSTAAIC